MEEEKNSSSIKSIPTSQEKSIRLEGNVYVYTDEDSITYEWDPEQKGWFPRVNNV
jgi:general stress protein 26